MEKKKKKDLAKIAMAAFLVSASMPATGNASFDAESQGTLLAGGGCGGSHSGNRPASSGCGANSGKRSPATSGCGAARSAPAFQGCHAGGCGAVNPGNPQNPQYQQQQQDPAQQWRSSQQDPSQQWRSQQAPGQQRGYPQVAADDQGVNRTAGAMGSSSEESSYQRMRSGSQGSQGQQGNPYGKPMER